MWLYTAASVLRAENIRNDIYKADVTRNTKAWKGVDVTFVDPERSRNSGAR